MIIVKYIVRITSIHWKRLLNSNTIFAGTYFNFDINASGYVYLGDGVGLLALPLGMIFSLPNGDWQSLQCSSTGKKTRGHPLETPSKELESCYIMSLKWFQNTVRRSLFKMFSRSRLN